MEGKIKLTEAIGNGISKLGVVLFCAAMFSADAMAASADEIQVYDDAINQPGELNMDLHLNYVPSGVKAPGWPEEIQAHHNFRFTSEIAYGINKNWEAGLYLPFIRAASSNWYFEPPRARLKYMADVPEQGFYWGVNGELGPSSLRIKEQRWNFEVRPIIGYKTKEWNLTANPILGFALSGKSHVPDFSPSFKVSRKMTEKTWASIEHFSGFGATNSMRSLTQETYLTTDTEIFGHDFHFGVGHGWTPDSNDWTIKSIFNIPL